LIRARRDNFCHMTFIRDRVASGSSPRGTLTDDEAAI
jgi:hypothetical protein